MKKVVVLSCVVLVLFQLAWAAPVDQNEDHPSNHPSGSDADVPSNSAPRLLEEGNGTVEPRKCIYCW